MMWVLIATLVIMCGSLILWGLLDRRRMLQYPFLAGGAVAVQFIPPLIASSTPEEMLTYPGGFALQRVALMVCLCLAAGIAGYFYTGRKPRSFNWEMNEKKLLSGALVLVAGGIFFGFMLSRLPAEQLNASQWSGMPVRYLFFASMGTYGFIICLLMFLKTWNKLALLGLLPGLIGFLQVIIMGGRRTPTAMLGLAVVAALWFCRKRLLPRAVMLAGLLGFIVFVFSIGDYRNIQKSTSEAKLEEVKKIDFMENLKFSQIRKDQSHEVMNAMYIMEAVSRLGTYDYGATLYNTLIAAYLPRQLVGDTIKAAFMARSVAELVEEELHYTMRVGSCTTGVADAFAAFSYFGCMVFFVQGFFMRRFWEGAEAGSWVYQTLYLAQAVLQLGAFNGNIGNITAPWIHIAIFAGPILIYAKARGKVWDSKATR